MARFCFCSSIQKIPVSREGPLPRPGPGRLSVRCPECSRAWCPGPTPTPQMGRPSLPGTQTWAPSCTWSTRSGHGAELPAVAPARRPGPLTRFPPAWGSPWQDVPIFMVPPQRLWTLPGSGHTGGSWARPGPWGSTALPLPLLTPSPRQRRAGLCDVTNRTAWPLVPLLSCCYVQVGGGVP